MKTTILAVADIPGWIVSRCVDEMISGIPEFSWTKRFWTETSHEEMAALVAVHDIVYLANWDQGPHYATVFDAALHPRVVVTVRSWRFSPQAMIFLQRHARAVTTVNKELSEHCRRYCGDVSYIPDGISRYLVPSRRRRVGFVGDRCAYKGFPLIEAACRRVDAELVVAPRGEGQLAPVDMPGWYELVDCVVVASEAEGFGTVAVEAMAMNCPVLTTDVGTAKDLRCLRVERSVEGIVAGLDQLFGRDQVWPRFRWEAVNREFSVLFEGLV